MLHKKIRFFFFLIVFCVSVITIFAFHFLSAKYPVKAGQVSPSTIRASQDFTFEDAKKTAERRELAANNVGEVYVLDRMVMVEMEKDIEDAFAEYNETVRREEINTKEKIRILKSEYNLSDVAANVLLYMETDTMKALTAEAVNLLRTNWQMGVRDFEVEEKKEKILNQIELLNYNSPYRDLIKAVYNKIKLYPNYRYDEVATMKAKEDAAENEGPVLVTIHKGQKIVNEGEVVTAEQMDILQYLGYQRASPYISLIGATIFLFITLFLTVFFLKYFCKDIYKEEKKLIILSLTVFIIILLTKLILSVNISDRSEVSALVGLLVPVAAGSMLITILLDNKLAVYVTIVLSFFVGILADNQLFFAINAFIGGMVGVFSVSRFTQRLDWVRAGLFIAAANVVGILALGMMNSYNLNLIIIGTVLGVINGFFSAIFAYGSLPFFEHAFKITTSVRLMEMSNPNQHLLKRLLLEAPGTYHHSVLVGNLAEAAADAVDADTLLVRVGAYYHDIGKLKRPYFFIENQLGGDNPHAKLTPALSTLIITSHVKDGLELAQQHGIPPAITDFITQHHGTSLVTYFYHKALELGHPDNIKESEFRYEASKPQSKEAAIVMLADNVEAAVRSMSTATPGKIEGLVRKIVKERLQDGQLDESALTFKDLDLIAQSFTRILNGIFHTRIEYPENVLKRMEGGELLNEDSDKQSNGEDSNQEN
ncbi:MAG: phosphohydrolase [Firmicutes bacterium HGW-Firmicutes-12]|nr:MAG: phosphohydrolase [Firmicutes bacterium HGW-Firmicutes-12]